MGRVAQGIVRNQSGGRRRLRWVAGSCVCLAAAGVPACFDISIPIAPTLFPTGTSFVVRGTAAVVDQGGPCLVWFGENGVTYHLFQDPRVPNEDFDRVARPGTTSRLVLATRQDLTVTCEVGTIVEVQDILEVAE
jgi:hypothetical protein